MHPGRLTNLQLEGMLRSIAASTQIVEIRHLQCDLPDTRPCGLPGTGEERMARKKEAPFKYR